MNVADLNQVLSYVGASLVGVLVWIGLGIFKRLDKIDAEQEQTKRLITTQIAEVKEMNHALDKRVIVLEERSFIARARGEQVL